VGILTAPILTDYYVQRASIGFIISESMPVGHLDVRDPMFCRELIIYLGSGKLRAPPGCLGTTADSIEQRAGGEAMSNEAYLATKTSRAANLNPRRRPTRASICVDMDEVIADTLHEQILRYNQEFNEKLTLGDLSGQWIWDFVPPDRVPALERQIASEDFYSNLSAVPYSQVVQERLQQAREVYIATAVMEYPRSFGAKYDWLRQNFPFIQPSHIVFCGDKAILRGDFLVDDNPLQLRHFQGRGILFSSPANHLIQEFPRVNNWWEIERFFLNPPDSS
jgi:5'(3')-deoxyribonucleotidase